MNISLYTKFYKVSIVSTVLVVFTFLFSFSNFSEEAQAQNRTWYYMPTGNGHGFQIYDRREGKMTYFLEHPYRFVAPSGTNLPVDRTTPGVGRRDLAHDIYFGVSVNGSHRWLNNITDQVSYEEQTNIIKASSSVGGVTFHTHYFAPFGLEANALVMLIQAQGPANTTVNVFSKPNLKFGMGQSRTDPSDQQEELTWYADGNYGVETGPGGGHALYVPVGGLDTVAMGTDASLYNAVQNSGMVANSEQCRGTGCVFVGHRELTLDENGEAWWGMAVLFVNDNPNHPQSQHFRDERNTEALVTLWQEFYTEVTEGEDSAKRLHEAVLAEWQEWRINDVIPEELNEEEVKIWHQSDTVLRMGQIREPFQDNRRNYGMFLAALPIGEWHTGWVRDGVYAVASMAMNGHYEESRLGLDFFLNAEKGVFPELGDQYRVSSCRYFGNGQEESDANHAGPNLETDGWGLVLWGAGMYLQYSCDLDWLNQTTLHGDTVFEALYQIARDIDGMIEESTGLPKAEASIWEVHWDLRQTFTYTAAAQARGLYDFAQIAYLAGREDLANEYWGKAERMHQAILNELVYRPLNSLASHRGVANQDVHVDGSTVEALHWGLVPKDSPVFLGTLSQYDRLKTAHGGYRRLEPSLSLTGEGGANEYDLSQWVLLDLRIGDMWREVGNVNRADELLDQITRDAIANDYLIPELYEPNSGDYAGVVPMVGYGAGAWQMSQLFKYNVKPPTYGAPYDACFSMMPTGGMEVTAGTEAEVTAGTEAEVMAGTENNQMSGGTESSFNPNNPSGNGNGFMPQTNTETETETFDWNKEDSASFCASKTGAIPSILFLFWAILGVYLPRLRKKVS